MNKLINYIPFILLALFIMACEDVVEIELGQQEEQLVIDGWINNLATEQTITLSMTANYFEAAATPKISDATVTLTKNGSTEIPFEYSTDGKYTAMGPIGEVGDVFDLEINWNGNQYCAQSEMNRVPAVDSIDVELRVDDIFLDDGLYTQFFARDPEGTGDAYWIKTFKNGVFRNNPRELNIAVDAAFDAGTGVDGIIFIPPIRELMNPVDQDFLPIPWLPGELVKVEIHSISLAAFQFLEIARDQMINGDNGIFALPVTNTRGNVTSCTSDALVIGFFNVAAVSSREKLIE